MKKKNIKPKKKTAEEVWKSIQDSCNHVWVTGGEYTKCGKCGKPLFK